MLGGHGRGGRASAGGCRHALAHRFRHQNLLFRLNSPLTDAKENHAAEREDDVGASTTDGFPTNSRTAVPTMPKLKAHAQRTDQNHFLVVRAWASPRGLAPSTATGKAKRYPVLVWGEPHLSWI